VGLSLALQLVLLYTPLATYFSLVHLGLMDWLIMIPLGASGLIFFELKKLFVKRKEK
jgi:hypothetical protein